MCRVWSLVIGHSSFVFVLSLVLGHWSFAAEVASPLSPADAQKQFVLADASLRIELAAAEPEVIDPVAIRFDEDGRMWVAEMRDYPLGPPISKENSGGEPLSQIRVLEDRDGDGRFETATTFADKLSFVTGLQPWKGGVFVTLAGRVAYMKDTTGDGRADLDETWYEGFAEQNSQLRANHPRLALDNHIYVANGLRGGKVVNRRLPDEPVIDISGMDFRFDPLSGKAEAVSGNGQFGLCFDDWGNRFTCSNRNPCRHVVIEDRYLRASPGVTVPAVMHDVAAFAENSRIFPISRAWTTSNLHAGQFTAACGVYIYRGDLLPPEFKGDVFTCDPTGNLIHREIMQPAGPTFTSKPAYEGKEFLASPDEWFRPVNMELGPDGALYVVDMYRCVIEHPDFVPDELKKRPDQRLGDDRGRIWRIIPANPNPTRKQGSAATKLSTAKIDGLVQLLEHPNAWQREAAQRLLVERGPASMPRELPTAAKEAAPPLARMHSLAALAGLGKLESLYVEAALSDAAPPVRRFALQLAERDSDDGQIKRLAIERLTDNETPVRFQAHLSAAQMHLKKDRMLSRVDQGDALMRIAFLMGLGPERASLCLSLALEEELLVPERGNVEPAFVEALAELAASSRERESIRRDAGVAIAALLHSKEKKTGLAALQGILRGMARQRIQVLEVCDRSDLEKAMERLSAMGADQEMAGEVRRSAIAALGALPDTSERLAVLVSDRRDESMRTAAIMALARQPAIEPWQTLLDDFPSDTPAARRAILDGVLANSDRTKLLLDAIEVGRIKPSELDPLQAKRLTDSRDASIKERAAKLFAAATPAERGKALADYQVSLEMTADARRGLAIFEKNCAVCHKIGDLGVNVAPDISDSRTKTAAQLLADILQPNRAIDNNYLGYTLRLADGKVASGILTTETATSITLRQQGGKDLFVARGEIDELKSSGQSLMPEGLERQIPPQDMADLLAFIKNWRYLDGRTPLSPTAGEGK
jgi:putative membrane-bound dehydrogenase-like protein